MAQRQVVRRAGILAILTVGLVFLWARITHNNISTPGPDHTITTTTTTTTTIVDDLSSARAPFVSWPLQRLCAETTPVPGLVFLCDNNSGGPGNIRNYILTCVRYAIEAGATALITPQIRTRNPDDPRDLFRGHQPLAYLFDAAHFGDALAAACPQLRIYERLEDVPGVAAKARREGLGDGGVARMVQTVTPKHGFDGGRGGCDARDQNRHTDRFGAAFRAWMADSARELGLEPTAAENPKVIRLAWGVLWDWPVYRDGPEFVASFGGLLRFRDDVLDLADGIVPSMGALGASSGEAEERGVSGSGRSPSAFLGVHLRTEVDALAQWPSYENQSLGYITEAERQGYRGGLAYLACGSETEARKFADEAEASLQLRVRSKYDLLEGRALEQLKAMSWDQQALVDYVVLLGADYFVGVSPSSFSINVALKRHLQREGLNTRPWRVGGLGDGRSWLVGRYDAYWDDWLFMFDGMWP
ncbi:Uu.00g041000.m01.CDS01 [Anthostomella pinea]|uniref:Uu.00g041000.m01.CDS01 n=1 Tax=Anthostomella pinea TaxID=933095 RepID=A0AAI8VAU0_9PEZI|nr:Uu.00g041000.m01.CDS01 [Anthostomella pinea]